MRIQNSNKRQQVYEGERQLSSAVMFYFSCRNYLHAKEPSTKMIAGARVG
jgi:hypothetical protein